MLGVLKQLKLILGVVEIDFIGGGCWLVPGIGGCFDGGTDAVWEGDSPLWRAVMFERLAAEWVVVVEPAWLVGMSFMRF